MRPFIYILLLAALLMFYKTFYLDYKKKEILPETNTSVEAAPVVVEAKPAVVETVKPTESNNTVKEDRTGWRSRKGMPIDQLGDSIGGSLKEKIKVQ